MNYFYFSKRYSKIIRIIKLLGGKDIITFRPRANVELLTQTGTDYKIENHLQSILEFNHFLKSDFTQLQNIYKT